MRLDWWPSAQGAPWAWDWHAYPGVWLVLAAGLACYVLLARRARELRADRGPSSGQQALFAAGLLVLWLSLDWPLGGLAAGYLLGAAAVQFLLITLLAAPLLLLGIPVRSPAETRTRPWRVLAVAKRLASRPVIAIAVFAIVLLVTHLPRVVDAARLSPLGSMAITAAWLGAALWMWWPLVGPVHPRRRLPYFAGVAYLFLPFVLPKVPGLMFAVHQDPLYVLYGTAPRVWGITTDADQHIAGIVLWSAGSLMIIVSLGLLFAHWYREDRRLSAPESLGIPADPQAVELLFAVPGGWAAIEQLIAIVDGALPSPRTGAQLRFRVRGQPDSPRGRAQPRVVLELNAALDAASEAALAERVGREYSGYLGRLEPGRREQIAARLAFDVVGYGSRVG